MASKDVRCPECAGPVHVERTETEVPVFVPNRWGKNYVEQRRVPAVVAFCNACDWVHEIPSQFLRVSK
jgi:hypothetical protein